MEDLEKSSPVPADLREVHDECRCLRLQVNILLVILLLVSGTFCAYLYRQFTYSRRDLEILGPQLQQVIDTYRQREEPVMNDFVRRLTEYAATHPDFAPIASKYGLKPANPGLPGISPATSAPPRTVTPSKK